jgi:hypothetical protein
MLGMITQPSNRCSSILSVSERMTIIPEQIRGVKFANRAVSGAGG